ncbi:MAG: metalloregulator ArsR/SmtB family transcription factor [Anaerolineales bacterium]
MDTTETNIELLNFFKALADANRLKIVGLLAQEELTVEQLAEMLDLRASTVSHHLARLSKAGLVSARAESYYNLYRLETKSLEEMAERLLARDTLPEIAADVDMDAYDRKVIKDYSLPDGRLKSLPSQRKKLEAVLRYIAQNFETGVHYSEKEINEILGRFHEDVTSLRRDLIEYRILDRERSGSRYWLVEE